ncbi:Permease of the drug/metabolite transporter (DMT) superfamily [Pseudomonas sp. FeS53a]|jgi:hypothetical protein|nr:EamA family transporter [Pseudomonas sp. FeS53a]KIV74927.1 Permease of the drug/metabolite transporter (DMT) superfamily [Pseudomonas sp. FeS53a]
MTTPSLALEGPARPLIYAKLTTVALLWGGTFIAGRLAAQALPPLVAACGRFAVAAALLLVLVWRLEGGLPRLDRRQVLVTALLGLTGIVLYNLFFLGPWRAFPPGALRCSSRSTPSSPRWRWPCCLVSDWAGCAGWGSSSPWPAPWWSSPGASPAPPCMTWAAPSAAVS